MHSIPYKKLIENKVISCLTKVSFDYTFSFAFLSLFSICLPLSTHFLSPMTILFVILFTKLIQRELVVKHTIDFYFMLVTIRYIMSETLSVIKVLSTESFFCIDKKIVGTEGSSQLRKICNK